MTSAFLIFAALMLIAALAFVLVPLLRTRVGDDAQNEARRRRKALEAAHADGILTDAEYAAKCAALAQAAPASAPARTRTGFAVALAVALLLPAAAILLYWQLGAPRALDPANRATARPHDDFRGHQEGTARSARHGSWRPTRIELDANRARHGPSASRSADRLATRDA